MSGKDSLLEKQIKAGKQACSLSVYIVIVLCLFAWSGPLVEIYSHPQ